MTTAASVGPQVAHASACAARRIYGPKPQRAGTPGCTSRALVLAVLAALLCLLALVPGLALAAQTREPQHTFGSSSTEPLNVTDPVPLKEPEGIAIDSSTGDVYVADTGNNRVEKFGPNRELILAFGFDVNKTKVTGGVATQREKDICTAVEIGLGEECQEGTKASTPGAFEHVQFVAVDDDPTSPSYHDVYVADTADNIVSKFGSEGELEESWATNGQLSGSGTFEEIEGIAVNSAGELYVVNHTKQVFEFKSNATLVKELPLTGAETGSIGPFGLAVNSENEIFAGLGLFDDLSRFRATGALVGEIPNSGSEGKAFALGPEGDLYLAGDGGNIEHYAFNTSPVRAIFRKDLPGEEEVTAAPGEAVLEPDGAYCRYHGEGNPCPPTDLTSVGFVGSGLGITSGGNTILSNASEGAEIEYGPLVTVPDVKTEAAMDVAPRSATLTGTVNPEEVAVTECRFEYVEAGKYKASAPNPYAEGHQVECEPPASAIGLVNEEVKVQAEIAGLTPATTYHFRLVAANAKDERVPRFGADETVATVPPPSLAAVSVSNLTSSSAVLHAEINPQGAETHYHFEYDTRPYSKGEAAHGVRVPSNESEDPSVPTGSPASRSGTIQNLEAEKYTYYWRVVATNEAGTRSSEQQTFRYEIATAGLPDGRAYELVTPSHKDGSAIGDASPLEGPPEIAADGSLVIAKTIPCFGDAQSCYAEKGDAIATPYAFRRTSSGWVTEALSPSASEYSTDTSWATDPEEGGAALFSMPTPPDGEDDFYVRGAAGSYAHIGPNTPPEDGAFGPRGGSTSQGFEQAYTANFTHFAWTTPYAWSPFVERREALEYAGLGNTQPLQVGVTGGEGSTSLISACGTSISAFGAISADGRTVLFTAEPCGGGTGENAGKAVPADTLYARGDGETPEAHTVAVSEPSPSACGTGSGSAEVACREAKPAPIFEEPGTVGVTGLQMSRDGSNVVFTSEQQLTDNAAEGGGEEANSLYEYEGVTASHASERRLVDVSEGEGGAPVTGGPRVQGIVALSPDSAGEEVYFTAQGVLTTVERPGCMAEWAAAGRSAEAVCHAVEGEQNLYVYSDETHRVSFITIMASGNKGDTEILNAQANVTPDGQFLVFGSRRDQTPDDTSHTEASQVFRYDAKTGRLQRLSIGYNGFNNDGNAETGQCGEQDLFFLCSEEAEIVSRTLRSDPTMSDDGSRVFFTSPVGLTPHALNDAPVGGTLRGGAPAYARNVYEWESESVGSCPANRPAGCVFLISDGRDVSVDNAVAGECVTVPTSSAVCLLGSDTTGDDVFFATADQDVEADTNSEVDFYDARVCEPERGNPCIQSPPPGLPLCQGEECHGVPAGVPPLPSVPSATFNGAGNVVPTTPSVTKPSTVLTRAQKLAKALQACRAMRKKRARLVCEASALKRYGPPPKAKKSTNKVRPSSKRRAR